MYYSPHPRARQYTDRALSREDLESLIDVTKGLGKSAVPADCERLTRALCTPNQWSGS